jgi:hypothetical protein
MFCTEYGIRKDDVCVVCSLFTRYVLKLIQYMIVILPLLFCISYTFNYSSSNMIITLYFSNLGFYIELVQIKSTVYI